MTPEQVFDKYRHLVVVNSERIALELSEQMRKLPQDDPSLVKGGTRSSGFAWLFNHPMHPDKVLESVVSPFDKSVVTSIYMGHPMFGSIGEWVKARQEIIGAISEKVGLSIESIGVDDEARGESLSLIELSTGQLLDLLAEQFRSSVLVSNSFGASSDAPLPV